MAFEIESRKRILYKNSSTIIIFTLLLPLTLAHDAIPPSQTVNTVQQGTYPNPGEAADLSQQTSPIVDQVETLKNRFHELNILLHSNDDRPHRLKRSSVDPTSPNTTHDKFAVIEKDVREISEALSVLNNSNSLNINDMSSFATMGASLRNFQASLSDDGTNKTAMTNFMQSLDNFKQQLKSLQKRISQREVEEAKGGSVDKVADHINSRRFQMAELRLKQADDEFYKQVVSEVYKNMACSFELLLTFGDSIQTTDCQIKFFETLYAEMQNSKQNDAYKLIRLGQSVKKIESPAMQSVYDNVWKGVLQQEVVGPIVDGIMSNNPQPMFGLSSSSMAGDCHQCIVDVYDKVLDAVWSKVPIWDILLRVQNSNYLEGHIAVHRAVFYKLQRTDQVYTNDSITLARYMKLTTDNKWYNNVRSEIRQFHEDIKNRLPRSVKNMVFLSTVCLKSVRYTEHLFASKLTLNPKTRYVYTWTPKEGNEPGKDKWTVNFLNKNRILLRNSKYNECCVFPLNNSGGAAVHLYSYIDTQQCSNDVKCTWDAEIDRDEVKLKNAFTGEYLYANHEGLDEGKRPVYVGHMSGSKMTESKWEIIECSN